MSFEILKHQRAVNLLDPYPYPELLISLIFFLQVAGVHGFSIEFRDSEERFSSFLAENAGNPFRRKTLVLAMREFPPLEAGGGGAGAGRGGRGPTRLAQAGLGPAGAAVGGLGGAALFGGDDPAPPPLPPLPARGTRGRNPPIGNRGPVGILTDDARNEEVGA